MDILYCILTITLGFLTVWFKTRQIYQKYLVKIQKKAVYLIAKAEKEYTGIKAGNQRMEYVVNTLHKLLPDWLQGIITPAMIKQLVQSTFDYMDQFAMTQMDRLLKEDDNGEC